MISKEPSPPSRRSFSWSVFSAPTARRLSGSQAAPAKTATTDPSRNRPPAATASRWSAAAASSASSSNQRKSVGVAPSTSMRRALRNRGASSSALRTCAALRTLRRSSSAAFAASRRSEASSSAAILATKGASTARRRVDGDAAWSETSGRAQPTSGPQRQCGMCSAMVVSALSWLGGWRSSWPGPCWRSRGIDESETSCFASPTVQVGGSGAAASVSLSFGGRTSRISSKSAATLGSRPLKTRFVESPTARPRPFVFAPPADGLRHSGRPGTSSG
mmetsp:Transcript_35726/g.121067  ORF Transcript_35726/g.121067 Transcript_35726/m.121067 type:complete len:276 (-) Transcript_35726:754-1581(-)